MGGTGTGNALDTPADDNFGGRANVSKDPNDKELSKTPVPTSTSREAPGYDPDQKPTPFNQRGGHGEPAPAGPEAQPAFTKYLSPVEAYLETVSDDVKTMLNRRAPELAKLGVPREMRELYLTTPGLYEKIQDPRVFAAVAHRVRSFGAFNPDMALPLEKQLELLSTPEAVLGMFGAFSMREKWDARDVRQYLDSTLKASSRTVL